jgi:hypothetical protein
MSKLKVTFKRGPRPTGLQAVGHPHADTEIKLNGKVIGAISGPAWNTSPGWEIGFMVEKAAEDLASPINNPNCGWRWAFFKAQPDEAAARAWVLAHFESLATRYTFRQQED